METEVTTVAGQTYPIERVSALVIETGDVIVVPIEDDYRLCLVETCLGAGMVLLDGFDKVLSMTGTVLRVRRD